MSAPAMPIGEILAHQSALTDIPTFARMTGQAESTIYQLAAEGRLPLELIKLGRKRYFRTVEIWKLLGLEPKEAGAGPAYEAGSRAGNDEGAGYEPAPPVEHIHTQTAK
ncbi:DNA-binding protein [Streptomyces sp. NPDC046977]|uniref:helix-turn-helix transcriptional regulator n=1 Tax=Streptomyces sp. NPDC046977 TaxID=3154703 RepID=UPI0033CB3772